MLDIPEKIIIVEQKIFDLKNKYKRGEKLIGTAFVTFSSQLPVKTLLKEFGVSTIRNLQFIFLNFIFHPYLKIKDRYILIQQPPDPTEIIWENLHMNYFIILRNYILL